jgi:glycosyltransferase involved in cell wall biosynthesis
MKTSTQNRVLMLLENLPFPQDVRVRREAAALTAAGYKVSLICPADWRQPSRETLNGVRVYRYPPPQPGHGLLGYVWEYGYSMAATFLLSFVVFFREGFDVIHAHNPPDLFVWIAGFYKLFGKRFVFDHHDLAPEMYQALFPGGGSRLVHSVLLFLEKVSCRLADHVIATNESYKRVEMERNRVPETRITIVRNGVELQHLLPIEPDPALRQMGKTIIGYVGVTGFHDGMDHLLRALHHLRHDLGRADFYCILIGGGEAWADSKALARELGLEEYVRFTGMMAIDDLLPYLSAADICVDPDPSNAYNDRSTMFKMMEYMALGKPIVAFDLPEHRVSAQHAAVYVTPNDELAFARALAELMDDPIRRATLGAYGRFRTKTQLAWEFSIPNLLGAYRTVLAEPGASTQPAPASTGTGMLPRPLLPLAGTNGYQPGDPS